MVNLRLKKAEVQELRLWGSVFKNSQEEIGMKWEEDQKKLLTKLNFAVNKDENGEPLEKAKVNEKNEL